MRRQLSEQRGDDLVPRVSPTCRRLADPPDRCVQVAVPPTLSRRSTPARNTRRRWRPRRARRLEDEVDQQEVQVHRFEYSHRPLGGLWTSGARARTRSALVGVPLARQLRAQDSTPVVMPEWMRGQGPGDVRARRWRGQILGCAQPSRSFACPNERNAARIWPHHAPRSDGPCPSTNSTSSSTDRWPWCSTSSRTRSTILYLARGHD